MADKSLFQVGTSVEYWRVLVHLSILVICLLLFEKVLHHVERRLARHDKYYHMLKKVYSELMILGLIGLALKILKEVAPIDSYSKPIVAFQVADLIIFSFAIALILQATCIFFQLREHSRHADPLTTKHLAEELDKQDDARRPRCWLGKRTRAAKLEKEIKYRLLRHKFLDRFKLPQLFPFSKYIHRAQSNQIAYMINVEPSMWLLLLAVAWGVCALMGILDKFNLKVGYALIKLLVVSGWTLVVVNVLALVYIRHCEHQLLVRAGYSQDRTKLGAKLREIASNEDTAWRNESTEGALRTMNTVHKAHEEREAKRKASGLNVCKGDMCVQLAGTCIRNVPHAGFSAPLVETQISFTETQSLGIRFPKKACHAAMIFLLVLNGFFTALFLQCALYNMDEIYTEFGFFAAVMVPLPMLVNALALQQPIFRGSVLIAGILHNDANTLGEVVAHFEEVIENRAAFATTLLDSLENEESTIEHLEAALREKDPGGTGLIEIDCLRSLLAFFGYEITRFRFNSIVKMIFELDGTRVEYKQVTQLLTLVRGELGSIDQYSGELPLLHRSSTSFDDSRGRGAAQSDAFSSTRHLPLLAQCSGVSDAGPDEFVYTTADTPALRRVITVDRGSKKDTQARRPRLQRSYTNQFARSSSRVLRDMFNIQDLAHSSTPNDTSMV